MTAAYENDQKEYRPIAKIEIFGSYNDENGKKLVPVKIYFIGSSVI